MAVLADPYARRMLESVVFKAKSVPDIMRECNIPMTSAYRRVKQLLDAGLLKVERLVITDAGVKYELYRSNVRAIGVRFEAGALEIDVSPNIGAAERMANFFFFMKAEK
ncbi:MAG: helix-turn-helix transcriptional regulator [Thaumarchaeota archaeon]|nr:helix-turn-helix transcriptional regulator [Nitrososphaerota archaeon]